MHQDPRVLKYIVVTFQRVISTFVKEVASGRNAERLGVVVRGKPQKTAQRPTFVFGQRILGSSHGHPDGQNFGQRILGSSHWDPGGQIFVMQGSPDLRHMLIISRDLNQYLILKRGNPKRQSHDLNFTKELVFVSNIPRSLIFMST